MYKFPKADHLNLSALSELFSNTTTSYKYLYFLSLLDILKKRKFNTNKKITFQEIIIEMLANAWYPYTFFKLSFGTQDKITEQLASLNLQFSESEFKTAENNKEFLYKKISSQDVKDIIKYLKRYVPFRILCPFLKEELKIENVNRGRGNNLEIAMPSIAAKYFKSKQLLYYFDSDEYKSCDAIIFNKEWADYIEKNYMIIRDWASWEWFKYMQNKNPKTPDLENKLFGEKSYNSQNLVVTKKYITQTLEQLNVVYQKGKSDRKKLFHKPSESDTQFPIVEEIELLTVNIRGYACQIQARGYIEHPQDAIQNLQNMKVLNIPIITDFYFNTSGKYETIKDYLQKLDYLRLLVLEYLRKTT